MEFNSLCEKYKKFIFHKYEIINQENSVTIKYFFEIEGLSTFTPTWVIPFSFEIDNTVKKLVFSLGMIELLSYWKIACPKQVIVNAGFVNDIAWWKKLYFNGLGEFFYLNKISTDIESFMDIQCFGKDISIVNNDTLAGMLIPVGGGKDSIVSMELLGAKGNSAFMINKRDCSVKTAQLAGFDDIICLKRTLDNNMLELNKQGFLNGHTPFSAIVAFSAVLTAYIKNKKYVVLSNEDSANEPTVLNSNINHQYSKSFEFEQDFNQYLEKNINCGVKYLSFLRPISELQIAGIFAKHKKYLPYFRSCNKGSKTDSWCGNCPKCLFVAIILLPFLSIEEINSVFGSDIFNNKSLENTLMQIVGLSAEKPFECVGSINEATVALNIALQKNDRLPYLLQVYKNNKTDLSVNNQYKDYYNKNNFLTKEMEDILKSAIKGIFL
ncbi:MAG: hypothetical protein RSE93_05105 [Oscillospiraceae bacterium]